MNSELNTTTTPPVYRYLSSARALCASPWVVLSIILGAALALRIPDLNESLWFDELWATRVMLGSLYDLAHNAIVDVHPPSYLTFMFVWVRLFGDSELSVRLPPLLFGLSAIALTYLLCSRFVGKIAALIAAALVAVSPAHIWYSQEARHYSALIGLVLLALYAYVKAVNDQGGRAWLATYALASLAMVFTFFFSLVYVALTSIMSFRNRGPAKNQILAANLVIMALFAVFMAAKIVLIGLKTSSGHLREFDAFELWMLLFNWFPTGNAIWYVSGWGDNFSVLGQRPLMLAAHLFLLSLLAVGVVFLLPRFRKSASTHSWQLLAFFACLPVFMLLISGAGLKQVFIERSMLTVMPFYYGVLSFGLVSIPHRLGKLAAGAALAVLCVFGLLSFYNNRDDGWTVYKPNPDWRSTASYLASDIGESGTKAVVTASTWASVLTYYDNRFQRWMPNRQDSPASEEDHLAAQGGIRSQLRALAKSLGDRSGSENASSIARSQQFNIVYYSQLSDLPSPQLPIDPPPDTVYVIHNLYWSGDFDALKSRIEEYPGITLLEKHQEKGIEVFKFSLGQPNRGVAASNQDRFPLGER